MKKKDAYALKEFDSERIFQRRFFEEFGFGNMTDAEILKALSATDSDSLEETQKKYEAVGALLTAAGKYQAHLDRHGDRLLKYARAIERKITVDEQADVAELRERHKRARELLKQYFNCDVIDSSTTEILDKKVATGGTVINDVGRLCQRIVACYKELDEKIKMHYRRTFAQRLKQARKAAGFTQEEIAPRLGLSKNGYALYETARRDPSIPTLIRISQELKRPIDCFLGFS